MRLCHGAGALPPGLILQVPPDRPADESVAEHEHGHRHQEDPGRDPGDVGAQPPRLHEVSPAVVDGRAGVHLAQGEDEVLRGAEHQAARPGGADHDVCALRRLLERLQRVADGDVAVQGHHHHHVGGGEHAEHLQVLHDPAQKVRAVEAEGDLPAELRQHLEEGDHQVRQAQVLHEQVHAGRFPAGLVHGQQHAHVPDDRCDEREAQDGDLDLCHLLVPPERVGVVPLPAHVRLQQRAEAQLLAAVPARHVAEGEQHAGRVCPGAQRSCCPCVTVSTGVCGRVLWLLQHVCVWGGHRGARAYTKRETVKNHKLTERKPNSTFVLHMWRTEAPDVTLNAPPDIGCF